MFKYFNYLFLILFSLQSFAMPMDDEAMTETDTVPTTLPPLTAPPTADDVAVTDPKERMSAFLNLLEVPAQYQEYFEPGLESLPILSVQDFVRKIMRGKMEKGYVEEGKYREDMLFLWQHAQDMTIKDRETALKMLYMQLSKDPLKELTPEDILKHVQCQLFSVRNASLQKWVTQMLEQRFRKKLHDKDFYRTMAHLGSEDADLYFKALTMRDTSSPNNYGVNSRKAGIELLRSKIVKEQRLAILRLKEAANYGDIVAQDKLVCHYASGEKNTEAFQWTKMAAEQGLVISQYNLGVMFRDAKGVAQNDERAFYWFVKAALQGYRVAQHDLGIMYQTGQGVAQDSQQGLYWLLKAAIQDDGLAQNNLGTLYFHGKGIPQNYRQALRWFEKAAAHQIVHAQYALGRMYANCEGVVPDNEKAFKYFQDAEKNGSKGALYFLGAMYFNGFGVEQDNEQAFKYFSMADNEGIAEAQFGLGKMYAAGLGCKKNQEQAFHCFKKAAEQGIVEAQVNVASRYIRGYGVAPDLKKAFIWLEKAVVQGDNTQALRLIGVMYATGAGTKKDFQKAREYLQKAYGNGSLEALLLLQKFEYEENNAVKAKEKKAYKTTYQPERDASDDSDTSEGSDDESDDLDEGDLEEEQSVSLSPEVTDVVMVTEEQNTAGQDKPSRERLESSVATPSNANAPETLDGLNPQDSQESLKTELARIEKKNAAQFERDRIRKNAKYTISMPVTASLSLQHEKLNPLDQLQDEVTNQFIRNFWNAQSATTLKRADLPAVLENLGCKVEEVRTATSHKFKARFEDKQGLIHTYSWHPAHKTTRSSFAKGGFRQSFQKFLEGIGVTDPRMQMASF